MPQRIAAISLLLGHFDHPLFHVKALLAQAKVNFKFMVSERQLYLYSRLLPSVLENLASELSTYYASA